MRFTVTWENEAHDDLDDRLVRVLELWVLSED